MNLAEKMKEEAEKAAQQKLAAEQADAALRQKEYKTAYELGSADADKCIDAVRDMIKKTAADGKFELDVRVGETDSAHHFTNDAVTIGKYERTKELLIQDGFYVKDKISGNGYNYDGDGNPEEHHSWYDLSISWKRSS